jgi:NitT/TauT family transport system permease protein
MTDNAGGIADSISGALHGGALGADASSTNAVPHATRRPRRTTPSRSSVLTLQATFIALLLAAWQWLPGIDAFASRISIFNRDYVSAPSLIANRLWTLATGDTANVFWSAMATTLQATIYGLVGGTLIGVIAGLLLSQSPFAADVARPFISLMNATPLIAFLPIIVVIFGIEITSTSIAAGLLVVCLVFFNALEGGLAIRPEVIANAKLLGSGPLSIMLRVRLPNIMGWVFAVLPAATSFAMVSVVATEFLVGIPGVGKLLTLALSFNDVTLIYALATALAMVGIALFGLLTIAQTRIMHWWGK